MRHEFTLVSNATTPAYSCASRGRFRIHRVQQHSDDWLRLADTNLPDEDKDLEGRASRLRAPLYDDGALAAAFPAAPGAPTASLGDGRITGLCFRLE